MHEGLGSFPSFTQKLSVMAQAYNPSTGEMEARGSEFKAIFSRMTSLRAAWDTKELVLNTTNLALACI